MLDGLYGVHPPEGSSLSMLLGVRQEVMGEIIWQEMLVKKWQVFPDQ